MKKESMLTPELMYRALVDKDPAFEGLFIAAVKTTGIFCRPTCTARKPKPENVAFLGTVKEALQKGYRPCKVCRPLERPGSTPPAIQTLIDDLNADSSLKLKDSDLAARGMEPATIRRWFLKHYGVTFQAYQRMTRINVAFQKIQNGESVTSVAFDSGYESLSGFTGSFKSVFGVAPSNSRQQQVIYSCSFDSPLGPMFACAVEEGICLLEFADRKMLETELKFLTQKLKAQIIPGASRHFGQLQAEIAEYFEGKRRQFTVPLRTPGTVFQHRVWDMLRTIPYGTTRSYKQQALRLGKPEAVRAVAGANGMNRIAVIIPCHRVIGEDGSLTGYGGGLFRKQWLLDFERSHM
jgi:AraC family transcriptional regulator of adaptative response/methylated-DNA-[protein]-cysteine methyltransferase